MFKDFGRRVQRDLQRSLAARQVEHFGVLGELCKCQTHLDAVVEIECPLPRKI